MNRTFVGLLLGTLIVPAALAQKSDGHIHRLAPTAVDGYLQPGEARSSDVAASLLARDFAGRVGLDGDLDFLVTSDTVDLSGERTLHLRQFANGLRVYGAGLVARVASDGAVRYVAGEAADARALTVRPDLDAEAAVRRATRGLVGAVVRGKGAELAYVVADDDQVALAWRVVVEYTDRAGTPQRDGVFVDAHSGRIAARHPEIHTAKVLRTYTANNGTSLPGTLRCSAATCNTGDLAIDAAHNYAGATYDYYSTKFGRDSLNGSGMTLTSTAHYSSNYNNAFWNGSQMVYGDGDGTTFIALSRSLDVVAHELTHGVTDHESDLVYQKESGAINEALSDIFGAAVEAWVDGGVSSATWLLGEDIYTPGNGNDDALRYMNDPTADGYSRDYYPERLYPGTCTPNPNTNDNCGVHGNSGIANLAFVLMVQGGTHPRGKTTVNVSAIGLSKAEQIFYRAQTACLTASSNFEALRNCTAQAATDLYGAADTTKVHQAWDAVGVPGGGGTPPPTGGALQNGVAVTGLSASSGTWTYWTMSVPSGATNLVFQTSGGSGDADLYVRRGSQPTTSSYDCRPYLNGNNETCTFAAPASGTWHVGIRAYSTYSGMSLVGSYAASAPNQAPNANFGFSVNGLTVTFTDSSSDSDGTIASRSWNFGDGTTSTATNPTKTYSSAGTRTVTLTVTDDDGATDSHSAQVTTTAPPSCTPGSGSVSLPRTTRNNSRSYTWTVPACASTATMRISGGSGDADLYVRFGAAPTTSVYDCRPYLSGNNETCTFTPSQAGTYHIMVRAYSTFNGVTLTTSYE